MRVAFADDVVAHQLPQPLLTPVAQRQVGGIGHGQLDLHLGRPGAKTQLHRGGPVRDGIVDQLLCTGLPKAKGLQAEDVPLRRSGQGGSEVVDDQVEHAAQLPRHAWRTDHPALTQVKFKAHGAANGVVHDAGPRRQLCLLAVGGIQRDIAPPTPGLQVRDRLGVLLQWHPRGFCQHHSGQIVHRRPEPAVDDQDIRTGGHRRQLPAQQCPVVAHGDLAVNTQPDVRESLGDQGRIGVDGVAAHDFVAGQQQLHLGVAMHGLTP